MLKLYYETMELSSIQLIVLLYLSLSDENAVVSTRFLDQRPSLTSRSNALDLVGKSRKAMLSLEVDVTL